MSSIAVNWQAQSLFYIILSAVCHFVITSSSPSSLSSLTSSSDPDSSRYSSNCFSCASTAYLSLWNQLMHHYFPPKNFTDRCWEPDPEISTVVCRGSCFTLVEEVYEHFSTHAVMRGCVDRFLLFGIDEDVRDALTYKSECRTTDRRLLHLVALTPQTDLASAQSKKIPLDDKKAEQAANVKKEEGKIEKDEEKNKEAKVEEQKGEVEEEKKDVKPEEVKKEEEKGDDKNEGKKEEGKKEEAGKEGEQKEEKKEEEKKEEGKNEEVKKEGDKKEGSEKKDASNPIVTPVSDEGASEKPQKEAGKDCEKDKSKKNLEAKTQEETLSAKGALSAATQDS